MLSLIVLSFAGWDVSARRKAINLAGSDGYDYRLEYKSGGKPHLVRMANSAAPAAQVDLPGPAGSSQFGATVTVLPNGNFVVTDPGFDAPGPIADVGAVYLYDKATLTVISTLTGGKAGDQIGNSGIAVLSNGNFVVLSPNWDNPVPTVADVGAVTWCSAATGCNGLVTAGNSLIGGKASDKVGGGGFSGGVTVLTNGNYVVRSPDWDNPTGPVSNVGAVTWGNGTGGTVGMVTESNSLIGGRTDDAVGSSGASKGGVTALTNGNYAVASPGWDNPVGPVVDVGAVTWCNGMTGGTVGLVTAGNSLIGGRANDNVGSFSSNGGVTAFPNGNYAVSSPNWDNPTGPVANVGAVTLCNGTGGTVGLVTVANSLIGGRANDNVGDPGSSVFNRSGVYVLANGNYVVSSNNWDNPSPSRSDVGAVTFCNGMSGCTGLVTASNSLIGGTAGDKIGSNAVEPLTNGNYVVGSRGWTNPNGQLAFAGAATWCNGMTGTVGLVTASNSLIGGRADDQIGSSVTALTNGNYVVGSSLWDDPTGPVENVGAVTFCNGMSGLTGLVTTANSLTGGTTGDRVGSPAVTALTNGNYVVLTESWDNPTGPVANVGAATWGNGITGTVGLVTAGNSLIGGTANDMVGQGSVVKALANGNYIVGVSNWDNPMGPIVDSGAVTWCNGAGGTVGLVTAGNSLIGGTANDRFGNSFADVITALPDGNYVIQFNLWDNPSGLITDARAVTIGNGTGGSVGLITSVNSVLGTVTNGISSPGFLVPGFAYDNTSGRLFVGRAASNIVSIFNCPFCTIPPTITSCPENQSVNADAGQCTASVSFNPTATGLPAPAITCKVDATTITSPHNFPVGTSNVICTASNGIAPDATCSFTVTVTASSPPVLSYSSPQMAIPGQSLMISPATGPSDDGSVASIVVQNVTLNAPTPVTVTVDNTTGVVTVPSNMPPGSYTVIIRATDNCGAFTDATFTLNVACMAVTVNPPTLPNGFVGALYTQALGATGGTPGYTFTLDSGAFPPGLDIAGSNLTGTPTAAGVFNFTIKANDSGNCMGTQVYTVVISGNGLQFYPLAHPVRLVDTRIGGSACQTPGAQITGGTSLTVPARGVCGGLTIPVNAAAVTGNVTTVGATANGFLTIYPSTATQPSASNSNYQAGQTLNNVFTAGLGAADGAFKIFSVQTTDVIVDVTGYFAPPGAGGLFFHPLPAPVRLLDTREMQTACTTPETPVLAGMEFLQQGNAICGIPASAVALVGNAITVGPAAQGFLTLFASNEARPLVASGNYAAGQTLNSPFTVSLSPSGNFTIYSLQQTDLVVDVLGYYSAEVSDATGIGLLFSPLTSARLLDTRPLLPGCFTPGVEISAMTETSQAAREVCGIPATAQAIVGNVTTVGPAAQGFLTFWPSNVTRPNAATSNFAAGVNFNRHFTVGLGADGAFKMYALTSTHLVIDVSGSFAP